MGRHNQDKRTLVELKKILEIEGLLDTYSHISVSYTHLYALFDNAHQSAPNTKYAYLYRRCSEQKNQDFFASTCLYMDAYPPLYFTGRILYDMAFR